MSRVSSKGVRLNWTPLDKVKPVKLDKKLTTGKRLTAKQLMNNSNNTASVNNIVLVP